MIITLYTSGSKCHACTSTKKHMDRRGISYTELPLEGQALETALKLGYRTAPVVHVSIGGIETGWDGYRPDRIDALLRPMEPTPHD